MARRGPASGAASAPLRGALAAALLLLGAVPSGAELAVLTSGTHMSVTGWELVDRTASECSSQQCIRLHLESGATITMSLLSVERIVDDEIVDAPATAPEPGFEFSFRLGQPAPDTPFGALFLRIGSEHGLNPELLAALARAESGYDPNAVSSKGARGLLQLMPATAERFGIRADRLHDPARNALAAARYLTWLRRRYDDDLPRVLAAYNAGEGAVDAYDGVPPYRETVTFIDRVARFLGL